MQQRRILQHGEGPFVGIRQKRHAIVLERAGPTLRLDRNRARIVLIENARADDPSPSGFLLEEVELVQRAKICECDGVHAAQDRLSVDIDARGRIAKRTGQRLEIGHSPLGACLSRVKRFFRRSQ
jgi:hypothetical protein